MKKWLIGGIVAIVCVLAVCTGIVTYTLSLSSTVPSMGIIGGADGPTVSFIVWDSGLNGVLLTGGALILLIILLVAGVAVYKSRKKP